MLRIYASMNPCIYVSMYRCIYVSMYLCMHAMHAMYLCIYVSMYLCIYVSMYLCMYVCTYVCMYVFIFSDMLYVYKYIYILTQCMSHLSPVSLACTAHAVQHSQQNPQLQLKIAVEAMTHLIGENRSMNVIWLVVYLPPLKNMSSSVGVIIPNIWGKKTVI